MSTPTQQPSPFKMNFSKEQLKGIQPIPGGMYDMLIRSIKLVPTKDKSNPSQYLKIELEPQGLPADQKNRRVFDNLSEKMPNFIQDFVHGAGMTMEPGLPGDFIPAPADDKDKAVGIYKGPLLGRVVKTEVVVSSYNGKPNNKVKQYVCKVTDCSTKFPEVTHSSNHIKQ